MSDRKPLPSVVVPNCPKCGQPGAADDVIEVKDSSGAIIGTEVTFWVCLNQECEGFRK